ncbi:MAG: hypothetical protein QOG71_3205 [Pyrinomonadaceae bacterium]|nr:hypothetical protein [Pyrinomonadaceae bacterium]
MLNEMRVKISKRSAIVVAAVVLLSLAVFNVGCNRSSAPQGATQNKLPAFERDLASVKRNNFQKVYVIARPDGATLNADDKAYLKTNMPIETTMRILTDEDRRLIVGTNFDLKPEHLDALNKRFRVEDYTGR